MVGKEDPAVLTCQQHFDPTPWINQILIPLSNNLPARRAKWPQEFMWRETPFLRSKERKKMVWSDTCKCWVWGHRRGYMESSHPDQPGLATRSPEQLLVVNSILLLTPCAGVIWIIPQIHTDQSRFFLSDTEQFPPSALEKDRGNVPICPLHEAPQIEKILCSSNCQRTATQKSWCFTLKWNPS